MLPDWRIIGTGAILAVAALAGAIGLVSQQEQDNAFCASCHTQPEVEYFARFQRSVSKQDAEDLAAFHHRKQAVKCIDCHGGEGVVGRGTVLTLAAWDALKHYTGTARQPAVIVFPVQNEACSKCHGQEIHKPGFENHIHNKYFDPKENPPFIRCTDCHVSHRPGDERQRFQFRDAILPQCDFCHVEMGRGPRGLVK